MAEIAVQAGHQTANTIIDSAGPETFSYEDMVKLIRDTIGTRYSSEVNRHYLR